MRLGASSSAWTFKLMSCFGQHYAMFMLTSVQMCPCLVRLEVCREVCLPHYLLLMGYQCAFCGILHGSQSFKASSNCCRQLQPSKRHFDLNTIICSRLNILMRLNNISSAWTFKHVSYFGQHYVESPIYVNIHREIASLGLTST